jgi:nucleoside phosphorylase
VALVLVVAAEPRELSGILSRCQDVRRLDWPVWYGRAGDMNGNRLLMIANGPGPVLAEKAVEVALHRSRPSAVVSTGYCGALDEKLGAGEVFVASKVEAGGVGFAAVAPVVASKYSSGTLISTEHVAGSVADKRRMRDQGASAVDMEAAAVACPALKAGLPFYCIRAVLDRADEKIVGAALARPFERVPELWKIGRRGRKASRALGAFLAECAF